MDKEKRDTESRFHSINTLPSHYCIKWQQNLVSCACLQAENTLEEKDVYVPIGIGVGSEG